MALSGEHLCKAPELGRPVELGKGMKRHPVDTAAFGRDRVSLGGWLVRQLPLGRRRRLAPAPHARTMVAWLAWKQFEPTDFFRHEPPHQANQN